MKILAIDTSGQQAGAAIVDEYITIGEININAHAANWHHSERLMPAVDQLFELMGMKLKDMDYIAYTAGPGSFTGLRIGAAAALGLARGAKLPCIPVPTLDALAYNIGHTDSLIMPMMDARGQQVYTAVYGWEQGKLRRKTDYLAIGLDEALKSALKEIAPTGEANSQNIDAPGNSSVIFLGDGADAYKQEILEIKPTALFAAQNANRQRAASVGVSACAMIQEGFRPGNEVELLYVRKPQAIRNKEGSS